MAGDRGDEDLTVERVEQALGPRGDGRGSRDVGQCRNPGSPLPRRSTLIAACVLAALAASAAAPARAADPRPHVVVIMTDDQTVNDLGSMRLTRGLLARGG